MDVDVSEKVIILIDGGNTYGALFKERIAKDGTKITAPLKKGEKFNYKKFAEYLTAGRTLVDVRYYVGILRDRDHTEKSQKLVSSQQKFLQGLENDGIMIERGRVVYDNTIREKGVDVKMAVDLAVRACDNEYDTAILISSDSDLVPAVQKAIAKGKKVQYIGFEHHFSTALLNEATLRRVLGRQDLEQFIVQ